MSRKTWLAIAAIAELVLGAYFVLAFFAWVAKSVLASTFNSANNPAGNSAASFPIVLLIWLVLAAVSFVLYNRTKRKINTRDNETLKTAKELKTTKETKQTTAA